MSNSESTCENCGHHELESFIDRPNHRLKRCPKCRLFQKGVLESTSVYEGDYHINYSGRRKAKIVTGLIRLASTTRYLETKKPNTLDIGCSVGATVQAATDLGWEAHGVDISKRAVEYCNSLGLNCKAISGVELPYEDASFDLVTNWHVIEHVRDVSETIREWSRVLKPGGIMILETPASNYLKARIMGPKYKKFWPPDHLYTFDRSNLTSLLRKGGFEILPSRLIGKATALPLHLSAYALAYRGFRTTCRAFNLCKSIEICCRKPTSATAIRRAA